VRICIFGAGAIGSVLAVRLALAGQDVCVVARGDHLRAIQERGLTLKGANEQLAARVRASQRPADLGSQDCVIVTVKANTLPDIAEALMPLLGRRTPVVFVQNGIPWWYRTGLPRGAPRAPDLQWLDPHGTLHALIDRTLGAVVFAASEVTAPGVVQYNSQGQGRLVIGEIDDRDSDRVDSLRSAIAACGIASPRPEAIRHVVWTKLLNNMTGATLAALAGQPSRELRKESHFEILLERLRAEAISIAQAHGFSIEPVGRRGSTTHTPSILQDFLRHRPMEIDALVLAPLAFARAAGVRTPSLDLLGALLVNKAQRAGLYAPARDFPI
jgi:2-dehydropantoate 2-reductase